MFQLKDFGCVYSFPVNKSYSRLKDDSTINLMGSFKHILRNMKNVCSSKINKYKVRISPAILT